MLPSGGDEWVPSATKSSRVEMEKLKTTSKWAEKRKKNFVSLSCVSSARKNTTLLLWPKWAGWKGHLLQKMIDQHWGVFLVFAITCMLCLPTPVFKMIIKFYSCFLFRQISENILFPSPMHRMPILRWPAQWLFSVCAQPTRDYVTLYRRLWLVGHIHRMITAPSLGHPC